jgi:hypothetical protein
MMVVAAMADHELSVDNTIAAHERRKVIHKSYISTR